jgi:hypothetical protein
MIFLKTMFLQVRRSFVLKKIAFDNYSSVVEGPTGEAYSLALWDTSGQDNDTMRPLSYNDAV